MSSGTAVPKYYETKLTERLYKKCEKAIVEYKWPPTIAANFYGIAYNTLKKELRKNNLDKYIKPQSECINKENQMSINILKKTYYDN